MVDEKRLRATVIGDVVGSREKADQDALFRALEDAHDWLNERVEAEQPAELTIGDEFQAVYRRPVDAVRAVLFLRLRLHRRYDLRFGIGWGEITSVSPERAPRGQSGKGWWRAREAIGEAAKLAGKRDWPPSVRTRFRGPDDRVTGALNAVLLYQDQLIARMDAKDARITLGLFFGERQTDLAEELGIAQSAISRRQGQNGASTIYRAFQMIEERSE